MILSFENDASFTSGYHYLKPFESWYLFSVKKQPLLQAEKNDYTYILNYYLKSRYFFDIIVWKWCLIHKRISLFEAFWSWYLFFVKKQPLIQAEKNDYIYILKYHLKSRYFFWYYRVKMMPHSLADIIIWSLLKPL